MASRICIGVMGTPNRNPASRHDFDEKSLKTGTIEQPQRLSVLHSVGRKVLQMMLSFEETILCAATSATCQATDDATCGAVQESRRRRKEGKPPALS